MRNGAARTEMPAPKAMNSCEVRTWTGTIGASRGIQWAPTLTGDIAASHRRTRRRTIRLSPHRPITRPRP